MDAREFFYITASIAFILISLFIIVVSLAVWWLRKVARINLLKFGALAGHLGKTWSQLTLTSMVLRGLTTLLRRR